MKKLLALVILIALFLNYTGYHLYYYYKKMEIRSAMRQWIVTRPDLTALQHFSFAVESNGSIAGLQWDNDKEFRFEGQMYDIVEKRIENGKVIISCINDKLETTLVHEYEKTRNDDFGSSKSNAPLAFLKLITSLFTFPVKREPIHKVEDGNYPSTYSMNLIPSCFPDVLTPPPRF